MATVVVIGAQWGDEGKGKVVDILGERAGMVVRFQGGNNAGHTLVVGGEKTVLHLVPSGILNPDVVNVVAQGVVVDPWVLAGEIRALAARGALPRPSEQLVVSARAAVITPYHKRIDLLREARLRGGKIGTTGRGIGPAYEDAAARRAIRVGDLLDRDRLEQRLDRVLDERNALVTWLGGEPFDRRALVDQLLTQGAELAPHVRDTAPLVQGALADGVDVVFEGAQGALLDVFHGTYPYVTSSSTQAGAVAPGVGLPPSAVQAVVGIVKAYATRVGEGPFPSELDGALGERLRTAGKEFGSTTGRPRRCGWLDLPALRYAHALNRFSALALTKLDVLTGFDTVRVATSYRSVGGDVQGVVHTLPIDEVERGDVEAVYKDLPGWSEPLDAVTSVGELPANALAFVREVEAGMGVPVKLVGVGPGRHETLVEGDLWAS